VLKDYKKMTTDKNPNNSSEQQKADFRKAALEYH
jgi:hypothetical protein